MEPTQARDTAIEYSNAMNGKEPNAPFRCPACPELLEHLNYLRLRQAVVTRNSRAMAERMLSRRGPNVRSGRHARRWAVQTRSLGDRQHLPAVGHRARACGRNRRFSLRYRGGACRSDHGVSRRRTPGQAAAGRSTGGSSARLPATGQSTPADPRPSPHSLPTLSGIDAALQVK